MPRQARILLPKSYYHIMTRGNNRHVVFRDRADYQQYLSLLATYKSDHPFDLFHYCLMPNHVHLLVRTKSADEFATFMKRLNLAYFYYYKKRYGWIGHFWQGRYKSQPIGKDSYFIQCGKYIELNPVRAKIVLDPADYLFSSYSHYLTGKKNVLLTDDLFYGDLGRTLKERQLGYKKLVVESVVEANSGKDVWGEGYQSYQEKKKRKYHLSKFSQKSG